MSVVVLGSSQSRVADEFGIDREGSLRDCWRLCESLLHNQSPSPTKDGGTVRVVGDIGIGLQVEYRLGDAKDLYTLRPGPHGKIELNYFFHSPVSEPPVNRLQELLHSLKDSPETILDAASADFANQLDLSWRNPLQQGSLSIPRRTAADLSTTNYLEALQILCLSQAPFPTMLSLVNQVQKIWSSSDAISETTIRSNQFSMLMENAKTMNAAQQVWCVFLADAIVSLRECLRQPSYLIKQHYQERARERGEADPALAAEKSPFLTMLSRHGIGNATQALCCEIDHQFGLGEERIAKPLNTEDLRLAYSNLGKSYGSLTFLFSVFQTPSGVERYVAMAKNFGRVNKPSTSSSPEEGMGLHQRAITDPYFAVFFEHAGAEESATQTTIFEVIKATHAELLLLAPTIDELSNSFKKYMLQR